MQLRCGISEVGGVGVVGSEMGGREEAVSRILVVVGIVWQVVPLSFFRAQAQPNGLSAATGYISTPFMSAFPLQAHPIAHSCT
jgi:hypothetical protein